MDLLFELFLGCYEAAEVEPDPYVRKVFIDHILPFARANRQKVRSNDILVRAVAVFVSVEAFMLPLQLVHEQSSSRLSSRHGQK